MKKLSPSIKSGLIGAIIGFSFPVLIIVLGNLNFSNSILKITDYIFEFLFILTSPFFLLNLCKELGCIFFVPLFVAIEGFIIGVIISKIKSKK